MSTIPTISFVDERLAERLLDACTKFGFFYLTDLPFSSQVIEEAWQASEALFLTEGEAADGQREASRDREGHTGYTAVYEEKLDTGTLMQGDKKESFYIASPIGQRQRLPILLEPFADSLDGLLNGCRDVCASLLTAIAGALDVNDETYFVSKHNGHDDRLRLIHYPPSTVHADGIRAGSHTDYGSFTILFQRDVSGLQVLVDDRWCDVEPPGDGTAVVNVADALEFWSNGVLRSAQHRVVMPRTKAETTSRFSIAFFCQPDADANLAPLPLSSARQRGRSSDVYLAELHRKGISSADVLLTGGQHLQARLKASYGAV